MERVREKIRQCQKSGATVLYLNSNQLTAVPPELGQLTALTVLYLPSNQLTAVPPELGQLTALTELYLSSNQLTAVPPELGQLTALTDLYLNSNQLTAVPPELGQLTALQELYLNSNQLTTASFEKLVNLKKLKASQNSIPTLPLLPHLNFDMMDFSGNPFCPHNLTDSNLLSALTLLQPVFLPTTLLPCVPPPPTALVTQLLSRSNTRALLFSLLPARAKHWRDSPSSWLTGHAGQPAAVSFLQQRLAAGDDQPSDVFTFQSRMFRRDITPARVFVFFGVPGAGKTTLADRFFRALNRGHCAIDDAQLVRLDFNQKVDINVLRGAPPSLVGHEAGSAWINDASHLQSLGLSPVVLLDEFDKIADKENRAEVMNYFFKVFEGYPQSDLREGVDKITRKPLKRTVRTSDCTFIIAMNLPNEESQKAKAIHEQLCSEPFTLHSEGHCKVVNDFLGLFKEYIQEPGATAGEAFLQRISHFVPFYQPTDQDKWKVAHHWLCEVQDALFLGPETRGRLLFWSPSVVDMLASGFGDGLRTNKHEGLDRFRTLLRQFLRTSSHIMVYVEVANTPSAFCFTGYGELNDDWRTECRETLDRLDQTYNMASLDGPAPAAIPPAASTNAPATPSSLAMSPSSAAPDSASAPRSNLTLPDHAKMSKSQNATKEASSLSHEVDPYRSKHESSTHYFLVLLLYLAALKLYSFLL